MDLLHPYFTYIKVQNEFQISISVKSQLDLVIHLLIRNNSLLLCIIV